MNEKIKTFLGKFAFTFTSNAVGAVIAILMTLVIPKIFGDDTVKYGYLQLYIFYASYVGFFHIGWCDGLYLRDGGKQDQDLDRKIYSSQFILLISLEVIFASILAMYALVFMRDADTQFIFWMLAINLIVMTPMTMLLYVLQNTHRIREYSIVMIIYRVVYCLCIVGVFIARIDSFRLIILCDLIGEVAGLGIAIYYCRNLVLHRPAKIIAGLREAWANICVGIKLMLANITGMLIIGIVRWGIQYKWDVSTFGKVSLSLNVSNMMMVFIGAIAIVLYPTLKRMAHEKLVPLYTDMRNVLMFPALALLIFYYPIELFLSNWLPQYAESLHYMALLFPICIFVSKMSALVITYMQVLRLEKKLMIVNIIGLVVVCVTTLVSLLLNSLILAILSMLVNQVFRCVYAEVILAKKMGISVTKDVTMECLLTIVFVGSSWFIGSWAGAAIYSAAYILYLVIARKQLVSTIQLVHSLLHGNKEQQAVL